jgi:L-threonylcarbamoyladenylate synthase
MSIPLFFLYLQPVQKHRPVEEEIKKAYEIIRKGGIILYPTDTVWGIGCDATQADAVKRIYELKQRPGTKSMLVLIDSPSHLAYYMDELPPIALDLIACADRPLTIVYPEARNVAPALIAPDGTLAIRVTHEGFSQGLCRKLKRPLVSTSANRSGQPAPACFAEIRDEIVRSVDYVVHYRREETQPATPSAILRLGKGGQINIIRK